MACLTKDDFNQFTADNFFACNECSQDTKAIVRDKKRKYLAVFKCSNINCTRAPDLVWYKCRVCTHQNQQLSKRLEQHLGNRGHQLQVAAFERRKSKAYVENESICAEPEHYSQSGEKMVTSTDSGLAHPADDSYMENEAPFSHLHEDTSLSPFLEDQISTVQDWRRQVILRSPQPNLDLSVYFPNRDEATPTEGRIRNPENAQYYQCNRQNSGYGPRLLTLLATKGSASASELKETPATTALWCMLLAKLSDRLPICDQQILVVLLAHLSAQNPLPKLLPVPKDYAELRRQFISGRSSIPNLLPRPIIHSMDHGFAYVPIRDILQFHLANGQPLDPLVDLPYCFGRLKARALHGSSPRGKALLAISIDHTNNPQAGTNAQSMVNFPTEVVIWSDGFEANNTKKNRGSAHIVLVSIGTPEHDYHSGCNTYPVSLGPSSSDKSQVLDLMVRDLTQLFYNQSDETNKFYDGASERELSILLRVFCFLQDRPERCQWLCLAHCNGKYAARFGWTGDLSQPAAYTYLPSCSVCHELRMARLQEQECDHCANWCMDGLYFEAPADYPTTFKDCFDEENAVGDIPISAPSDPRLLFRNSSVHLPFRKISFKDLMAASDAAFDMVRNGKWKKKEGNAYLDTFALSPDYSSNICQAAEEGVGEKPLYPATWNLPGVDICHHIDVVMHLCFLGITKANSIDLVSGWLKVQRKSTSFYNKSRPLLKRIKAQSLSWCKAETRFGGYVSENWVAYCLISKFLHQLLSNLAPIDVEYTDPPGVPLSQYNLKQKKAWLLAREIEGIDGKSSKLMVDTTFLCFKSKPEEQWPDIVKPIASKASLIQVNHMIICWQVCMARVMSLDQNPTEGQVMDIDRHIKLFLSAVDEFDSTRRQQATTKDKKVPVWRRKPNYIGLLNYQDTIRQMGPLSQLSELDYKGEASIKDIKRQIKNGLSGNWSYNAMRGYYCDKSYQYVMKDSAIDVAAQLQATKPGETKPAVLDSASAMLDVATHIAGKSLGGGTNNTETKTTFVPRQKNYTRFKDEFTALERLNGIGDTILVSGLVLDNHFYLILREGIRNCIEIKPIAFQKEVCGACYFSYGKVDNAPTYDVPPVSKSSEFFLLLPFLRDNGKIPEDDSNKFYLVTSKWREVTLADGDGYRLQLPIVPGATYGE
ncbi:unnamed protein product [Cylindrotheca closterium]|uniref:Uncharacterized protein n=1 Tax=Cylindrotheca closterium TaxID=2856 RepID=A0AAD2FMW2_9STRA|nr:unnamed protein product [Cylindrotheca closterium]CAJ1966003.1 unnamed protein product [Cylindrotheca closterium]